MGEVVTFPSGGLAESMLNHPAGRAREEYDMSETYEDSDDRSKAMPVAEFEGEMVREFEGKLPALTLDMPEGYRRNTHILMNLEVRVREVDHPENARGDLVRRHKFTIEDARMIDAYDPASRPDHVDGNLSGDWRTQLAQFLTGEVDELDFDGAEIPDRLADMLKLYFEHQAGPDDRPEPTTEVGF